MHTYIYVYIFYFDFIGILIWIIVFVVQFVRLLFLMLSFNLAPRWVRACVCVFMSAQWKFMFLCGVLMANLLKPVRYSIQTSFDLAIYLYIVLCVCGHVWVWVWLCVSVARFVRICIIAFSRRLIDIRIKNDISQRLLRHKHIQKIVVYVPQKQPIYFSFFLSPHGTNMKNENKFDTKRPTTQMHKNTHRRKKHTVIIKVQIREKLLEMRSNRGKKNTQNYGITVVL